MGGSDTRCSLPMDVARKYADENIRTLETSMRQGSAYSAYVIKYTIMKIIVNFRQFIKGLRRVNPAVFLFLIPLNCLSFCKHILSLQPVHHQAIR